MNSFYRTCVYICMVIILATLVINFIDYTGAFPVEATGGVEVESSTDALSVFTDGKFSTMDAFLLVAIGTGIAAIGLALVTHSITPIGIHLYGAIFWGSYTNALHVLNIGGYLPTEFIVIFTAGMIFVFIASIIGMLTGSG